MAFLSPLINNKPATGHATQLEADLATGVRGGNKYRLIARCWVATRYGAECGLDVTDYDRFRTEWSRQTYAAIHLAFDHLLPLQYRADKGPAPAPATKPLSKKVERLARSFERTADLNDEQRQWVRDHGGVEALDDRKVRLSNGRTVTLLDSSWYYTAQHIQGVIDGRKRLV